jgi:hypothetical protein
VVEEQEEEEEMGRRHRRAGAAEAPAQAHGLSIGVPGLLPLRRGDGESVREEASFFIEMEREDGRYLWRHAQ